MMEDKNINEELWRRAKKVLPGGVNSPVRAFGPVGGTPRFIRRGREAFLTGEDGREYLDYVCSWGPMIFGHAKEEALEAAREAIEDGLSFGTPTRREVEMAELVTSLCPGVEMIRMVNSGTEAVMSAVRLARGATGRTKIIKFSGCYHGHSDSMLVKAGSGLMTAGVPDSLGVPPGTASDTLTAIYNDAGSVERLFLENPGQVAAVIVEPLAANMGVVPPIQGFLSSLRKLCTQHGALLIFDEVITGFRLALGGAQEYYGVSADLVTYGKIIGGGMPVGAYGGSRRLMEQVSPMGKVYQAGTLSGNPVAMAVGLAQLRCLRDHPELYQKTEQAASYLAGGFRALADRFSLPITVNQEGSLLSVFFTAGPVRNCEEAQSSDIPRFADYFHGMLAQGIYLAPSQFEAMFVSAAHTPALLDRTLNAAEQVFSSWSKLE